MIDGLKPYPKMKDSGIAWLGEVPAHWRLLKLRNVLRPVAERNSAGLPLLSVVRERGVILRELDDVDTNHNVVPDDLTNYKIVRRGQLAINKMKAWQGSYGVSELDGIVSPAYFVFDVDGADARFLHAALRSRTYVDRFGRASDGVRIGQWDLSVHRMKEIPLCIPPVSEQHAIVRVLDYADRRIRRYIGAKQKLIKLLEEQKQAIIHRAVTRGLDPNVRLKPSRIDWLGDIPEHWEVESLKHLVPEVTVGIVVQPARHYVDDGTPCLRSLNISGGSIRSDSLVYISPESNSLLRKSQVFAGDVVIVRTGNAGVAAVVTPEFNGANCIDLLIVRRSERLLSEYLHTYLNSWAARTDARFRSVGAIQAHYNTGTLANLLIPVPPQDEQQEILDSLSNQLKGLTEAQIRARSELRMLRELRDRLIADVVTGKLDVRRAALRLSDEQVDADRRDGGERHAELVGQRLDQGLERTEG